MDKEKASVFTERREKKSKRSHSDKIPIKPTPQGIGGMK